MTLPAVVPHATVGHGAWRSLVARSLWEREVASSNPAVPIARCDVPPSSSLAALALVAQRAAAARPAARAPRCRVPRRLPTTPAPLGYVDRGVVNHGYPIKVHDVTYTSAGGRKVDGLLAVPPGKGPFPAVVYLHGSGGDRTELLVPATWMAARGVVARRSPCPRTPPRGGSATQRLAQQRQGVVDRVIAVRRAVDALDSLPQVDVPDRPRRLELGRPRRRHPRRGRPPRPCLRSPLRRLAADQRVRSAGAGEPTTYDPA